MAFTIKLQSPNYNGTTNGSTISLPVDADALQGSSMADILPLPNDDNKIIDLLGYREIIQLSGWLTDENAADAAYRDNGTARTLTNAVQMRDAIRKSRKTFAGTTAWSRESVSGTWNDATLPADERDSSGSTNARAKGKFRLIYDKYWDWTAGDYANLFAYGSVGDFRFQREADVLRSRIRFTLTFLVGAVAAGTS